jgi:hypothetical protein
VDSEGVDTALRRLTWEEAASFEEERAEDLEPYGLNRPSFRIALSDGDTIEELLVGASADGGEPRRYARMADSPSVVTLRERVLEELPASLEEFRRETEEEEDQTTEQGE